MEEDKKPVPNKNMRIVGINLAVLAGYTIICALAGEGLLVADMFLFGIHVVVCIFAAIIFRNWSWLLSAVLILVIGFSTCVMIASMH